MAQVAQYAETPLVVSGGAAAPGSAIEAALALEWQSRAVRSRTGRTLGAGAQALDRMGLPPRGRSTFAPRLEWRIATLRAMYGGYALNRADVA
jgi:hypothetical protein